MNAQSKDMLLSPLVLRVLGGRQDGADYRLANGMRVTIGHSFGHDIVLRSADTKGLSLALELDGALARVQLVEGSAEFLGRAIAVGETIQLPAFVPVSIGDIAFAIGDPASERWTEASSISQAIQSTPDTKQNLPAEAAPEKQADRLRGAITHFANHSQIVSIQSALTRKWPLYAGLGAVVILALLLVQPISSWIGQELHGKTAIEEKLVRGGFTGLSVKETSGGGMLITGVLESDKDLTRLRKFAVGKFDNVEIDVTTMDGLAATATALLSAQGIDAKVRPGRGHILLVDSEYLPVDRQEELAILIRRDMQAVKRVIFRTDNARGDRDLQYFFSDPAFGLATYVDGEPAYIKTADGTRWFEGAKVPTGHTIIGIGNGSVRFERDGRIEILPMMEPVNETTDTPSAEDVTKKTG